MQAIWPLLGTLTIPLVFNTECQVCANSTHQPDQVSPIRWVSEEPCFVLLPAFHFPHASDQVSPASPQSTQSYRGTVAHLWASSSCLWSLIQDKRGQKQNQRSTHKHPEERWKEEPET